jgi:hypothetical protein
MLQINEKYLPYLDSRVRYLHLYGGSGCFSASQLVVTLTGNKPISEIKEGEHVLTFDHATQQKTYKPVTHLHKYDIPTDKLYRIKMKDGTVIEVTENHKFYIGGAYLKIKDILLSLANERMENNT